MLAGTIARAMPISVIAMGWLCVYCPMPMVAYAIIMVYGGGRNTMGSSEWAFFAPPLPSIRPGSSAMRFTACVPRAMLTLVSAMRSRD